MGQIQALDRMQTIREEKCVIMQRRAGVLEEVIKMAETLLITLDSCFNEVISKSKGRCRHAPGV